MTVSQGNPGTGHQHDDPKEAAADVERDDAATERKPVLVLCVGNLLMRDDGVGVHAARRLAAVDLPFHVELFEGGTAGLDLVDVIADRRKLVLVDAVNAQGSPGTVVHQPLARRAEPESWSGHSLHHLGMLEVLDTAYHLGNAPAEVVVIGVVPGVIAPGLELSPDVEAALPVVIRLVQEEVGSA